MSFETIEFDLREDGIATLSLNRPHKLNAITFQMEEEIHEVLDELETNLDCRILILKGNGDGFCSGIDIQEGLSLHVKRIAQGYEKFHYLNVPEVIKKKIYHQWYITRIVSKMRQISQPIIAAISGPAAGGGFSMALASDFRILSKDAKLIDSSANIGLTGADMGGSYFLPRLIGLSRASEILYTGREVPAEEAKEIGLAFKIVEKEQLYAEALKLAQDLLTKSPLGLRMTKRALNITLDSPSLDTIIQLENGSIVLAFESKDFNEASSAFLEKRKPRYPLK
jgi:enoyl-CoA hydratase/carnithine racemase